MISAVIQSSVLLSVALCAAGLLCRQSAATRHAVLAAGLASSLIVPFLGAFLPELHISSGSQLYARVQEQTEILRDVYPATGQANRESIPIAKPPAPMAASIVAKPSVSKRPTTKPAPRQGLADGSLWGTVYDGTGAVVPGVTITIANERTAEQMATGAAPEF